MFLCHFSWRTNNVSTNISNISHQRGGSNHLPTLFFGGNILERYSLPSSLAISGCLGSNASCICTRVGAAILCIHRHWPQRLAAPNAIRWQQNIPCQHPFFGGGGRNVGCEILGFEIAIKVSVYHHVNGSKSIFEKKTPKMISGSFPPAAI